MRFGVSKVTPALIIAPAAGEPVRPRVLPGACLASSALHAVRFGAEE
jgi:hypothetical protein